MEDVINPAVPTTVGALLAEEWTINPLATLPSFLEMFMMDEAARSARKSLDTGIGILQRKLESQATVHTTEENPQGATTNINPIASAIELLRKSSAKVSSYMARFLQTFGPEVSCLILYALERRCLRSEACATISESLYGGRKEKLERSKQGAMNTQRKLLPLSDQDKTRIALMVAIGPWIRHRLLLLYQAVKRKSSQTNDNEGQSSHVLLQKCKKVLVWAYPLLHVSFSSLDLVYQWRYLLGRSVFFHPYAEYLGVVVRRVTQEDSQAAPSSLSTSPSSNTAPSYPGISNNITNSTLKEAAVTEDATSPLQKAAVWMLSSAIMLSWISHFRSEYQRQRQEQVILVQQQQRQENGISSQANGTSMISDDTIPPPPSSGIADYALPPHLCPLCRQPQVNPTASTSGFVFCYKCLLEHVRCHGKCPITGRECKEEQLLRLYEPNATNNATAFTNNSADPGNSSN